MDDNYFFAVSVVVYEGLYSSEMIHNEEIQEWFMIFDLDSKSFENNAFRV